MPSAIKAMKITANIATARPDMSGGRIENTCEGLKKYFRYSIILQILVRSDKYPPQTHPLI